MRNDVEWYIVKRVDSASPCPGETALVSRGCCRAAAVTRKEEGLASQSSLFYGWTTSVHGLGESWGLSPIRTLPQCHPSAHGAKRLKARVCALALLVLALTHQPPPIYTIFPNETQVSLLGDGNAGTLSILAFSHCGSSEVDE